ncbi:Beta-galactoside alpha-2,6-sialyltransferase 2 [Frankliniella fusca]|uniref:Beta-galactoside alpha-2,6-sialyltransferase 2 n=1 Tax=Frankliniella fusca TaxID=407009 RepID=A0AAE1LPY4_9NEOP|nr:Beta-galactoside alpha-2,6-sialyltransferase 2 [Frankliniella fusca]
MPSGDPQPPALSSTVEPDPSSEDSASQEVVIGTGVQGTQTIFGDTNDVSVERDRELLDQGGSLLGFGLAAAVRYVLTRMGRACFKALHQSCPMTSLDREARIYSHF